MKNILTLKDILEEMIAREVIQRNSENHKKYFWLKNGEEGELECQEWLHSKIPNATILHDLQFEFNGRTQVDFLLITDNFWWVIEVKNYNGVFTYRNQVNELRGSIMNHDQILAMRNRMRIIKELAASINPKILVEGSMVFIHPESEVFIESNEEFDIVMRHQFNRHIEKIISEHPIKSNHLVNQYYQAFSKYFYVYPEEFPTLDENQWDIVRKGCRCNQCGSYKLKAQKFNMVCLECGKVLPKKILAQELYCQLCVLHHEKEKEITFSRLLELGNNQISNTTLWRSLTPFIPIHNKYKYSYLHNHRLPYHKLKNVFQDKK